MKHTLKQLLGATLVLSTTAAYANTLESAGSLEFGKDNVLFVGDSKAAAVHAFELSPEDFTSQEGVNYGDARQFTGTILIANLAEKIAALLATTPQEIKINDMAIHKPSSQIFLSVRRGHGADTKAVILKINNGKLELVDTSKLKHSQINIKNAPVDGVLEFGQKQRAMTITDITYHNGEIFVAGVSNEEFASKLRRAKYPFEGEFATTSVEIWHAVHAIFETRAPIITQVIREIEGTEYLIASYACTPLVRIPLADIKDGAKIRGAMIGELGYGNTPIDMITYTNGMDKKDYLLVTHSNRNATQIPLSAIPTAKPMPVNVTHNWGPAGISFWPIPMTGIQQIDTIKDQWAVVIKYHHEEPFRLDLTTLPMPFFFDRSDHVVEMNWPNAPDPFGIRSKPEEQPAKENAEEKQ